MNIVNWLPPLASYTPIGYSSPKENSHFHTGKEIMNFGVVIHLRIVQVIEFIFWYVVTIIKRNVINRFICRNMQCHVRCCFWLCQIGHIVGDNNCVCGIWSDCIFLIIIWSKIVISYCEFYVLISNGSCIKNKFQSVISGTGITHKCNPKTCSLSTVDDIILIDISKKVSRHAQDK